MKPIRKTMILLPLACLVLVLSGNRGFGGETGVVFECEDIGVEARRILSELKKKQEKLALEEKVLAERKNELKILEQEVEKKLEQLEALRSHLERLMTEKDAAEGEQVKKLSKIYQKRDPAGAAVSLAAMEADLAVSILANMRDKYAGEILDNMEKETAVLYSTKLGQLD